MASVATISVATIRAQIESRLPGALKTYVPRYEMVRTGIATIDAAIGGVPKNALTQICAPVLRSSGRTTVLLSLLAQMTQQGEFCALVDANDSFEPSSAADSGVELSRVLWIRCAQKHGMRSLEMAFKAADIVLQNGGFGLIVMDLGSSQERLVRKIPLTTWFRFCRVVEKMPTALLILTSYPAAQSCATMTLQLQSTEPCWQETGADLGHTRLLTGMDLTAEIARTRLRKPPQSVRPQFRAIARWA